MCSINSTTTNKEQPCTHCAHTTLKRHCQQSTALKTPCLLEHPPPPHPLCDHTYNMLKQLSQTQCSEDTLCLESPPSPPPPKRHTPFAPGTVRHHKPLCSYSPFTLNFMTSPQSYAPFFCFCHSLSFTRTCSPPCIGSVDATT
jgi:hypothetical protein